MTNESPQELTPSDIYSRLLLSLVTGYVRLLNARVGSSTLTIALLSFRMELGDQSLPDNAPRFAHELFQLAHSEHDAHAYVTSLAHLIYAITLLDSFLSDTTLFLHLLHPPSIGKNQAITVDALLRSNSKFAALTEAAKKKTRDVSYLALRNRVDYLVATFGLKLDLGTDALERLDHLANLRNTAIHDQGFLDFHLDDNGRLRMQQHRCPWHPTPVSADDIRNSFQALIETAVAVGRAVATQVLHLPESNDLLVRLGTLAQQSPTDRPGPDA